jgi:hypothetical protein
MMTGAHASATGMSVAGVIMAGMTVVGTEMTTGVTDGLLLPSPQVVMSFCSTGFRKSPGFSGLFPFLPAQAWAKVQLIETELFAAMTINCLPAGLAVSIID